MQENSKRTRHVKAQEPASRPVAQSISQPRTRVLPAQVLLRTSEAAHALGISRTRVYELVRAGALAHVLLGGTSIRIPRAAIDELVAEAMGRATGTD
jgi:excisionase family DNA binding protein